MKFLVDANVLSEPTKPRPDEAATDWIRQHEADCAVNAIIFGELEYGVLSLPAGRRRTVLLNWLASGIGHLRILELDRETADIWANRLSNLKRTGREMPVNHSLIAATALQY